MTYIRPYAAPLVVAVALVFLTILPLSATQADTSLTIGTNALLALSLGLAFGQGGIFSGAQAAFGAVGGYATAIATTTWSLSPFVGLVLAIVLAAAVSWALARLIVRLSPLALALATIVFSQMLTILINQNVGLTGGYIGIAGIPRIPGIGATYRAQILVWAIVLLVSIGYVHLRDSIQGQALRTIRHDATLAQSLGINVTARLSALFALSGGIAGLAGWVYAHSRLFLSPQSLPLGLSIILLMMVVVGGRTTVLGPVVGAVLFTLLQDWLPGQQLQNALFGLIVLIVMLAFPAGIVATDWRAVVRQAARHRRPSATELNTPTAKVTT